MTRLIIKLVAGALICLSMVLGYKAYFSRSKASVSLALQGPFEHERGNCWQVPLPQLASWSDSLQQPEQSTLMIYENGRPLGPGHALHDAIRTMGEGRFAHWGEALFFSTSDNSDPNQNGRQYSIQATAPPILPVVVRNMTYLLLCFCLAGGVVGLALMALFSGKAPMRHWLIGIAGLNALIIFILSFNEIPPLSWYGRTVHIFIFLLLLVAFTSCFLIFHEVNGSGGPAGVRKLTFTAIHFWSLMGIFLLLLEVFFRIFPRYDTSSLNPGVKFFWSDYVNYPLNAMGYRDRPFSMKKDPHTYRILAVGDSYTEGAGCRREETFPAVLERELNRRLQATGCPPRVEVYNLSHCGANTTEEVDVILKDVPVLKPDLIVLAYVLNDPEVHPTDLKTFDPPAWVNDIHKIFLEEIHSYAYYWFFNTFTLFKGNLSISDEIDTYCLAIHDVHYHGWKKAVESLSKLKKFLDEQQMEFFAIIYPEFCYKKYPIEMRSIHKQVEQMMKEKGLEVIDLLNLYEGIDKNLSNFAFSLYDAHPNIKAQQLLGQYLANLVLDRKSFAQVRQNCESTSPQISSTPDSQATH